MYKLYNSYIAFFCFSENYVNFVILYILDSYLYTRIRVGLFMSWLKPLCRLVCVLNWKRQVSNYLGEDTKEDEEKQSRLKVIYLMHVLAIVSLFFLILILLLKKKLKK